MNLELLLDYTLDFIFPRENINHTSIHCYLSESEINDCKATSKNLDSVFTDFLDKVFICSDYQDKLISNLITRAKFNGETDICKDLALLVYSTLFEKLDFKPDILIPIPSDPKRYSKRGYHIPYLITKKLGELSHTDYVPIVVKNRSTKSQIELSREERLTNLNDVFVFNPEININLSKYSHLALIDDLTTTGSTFLECSRLIKKAYPFLKITGVAVASN